MAGLREIRNVERSLVLLVCLSIVLFFAGPSVAAQSRSVKDAKRALIISLDGLDWRYISSLSQSALRLPTLRRLMNDGVSSAVITVYPSVTYPAHTSIVTGAYPARHGIFSNEVFDPSVLQDREWFWFANAIQVETLWDAAARRGLSTAMVSWPVATGAGDFNVPEILKFGGTFQDTLARIKANARPQGLVEEIERADPQLYSRVTKDEQDDMRTRFAEYIIEKKRPRLTLVHLFDLDHIEHEAGPFTPEVYAILEKTDAYVGRLLAAAERAGTLSETAVFIVSDHGFLPISKQVHPGVMLARAGLLKLHEESDGQGRTRLSVAEWRAMPYCSAGSCAIILHNRNDRATLNRVRTLFNDFELKQHGALSVLESWQLRALHANPQAAIMLEAGDGYSFGSNFTGEPIIAAPQKGTHGYLPSKYLNTFIAAGAGVRRRGLLNMGQPIRLIDLGPTIARALGFKLRDAEGALLSLR